MKPIDTDAVADLFFQLRWSGDAVRHTEAYAAADVNFWRDLLPRQLKETLMGKVSGDQVRLGISAQDLIGPMNNGALRTIAPAQFDGDSMSTNPLKPRAGRFYPKGILKGVPNIFRGNMEPFRLVGANNGRLTIDTGHPLKGYHMELSATVGSVRSKLTERGGNLHDWGSVITRGVGMQARWRRQPTDFFSDTPFARRDEDSDEFFYIQPRLVAHIDATAGEMVSQLYSRFMSKGHRVLDLMSGWQSHLPSDIPFSRSFGIGLNAMEMAKNRQLSDYGVFDLNRNASLPLDSGSFDVAVCSLSVEYLTAPIDVFQEVARVLRPGGWFVVTFSNRWFESKAIRIWPELHEFERMGLVLEYFRRSKRFTDLETYSIKGLERPAGDKYYGKIHQADPVYAVWGKSVA